MSAFPRDKHVELSNDEYMELSYNTQRTPQQEERFRLLHKMSMHNKEVDARDQMLSEQNLVREKFGDRSESFRREVFRKNRSLMTEMKSAKQFVQALSEMSELAHKVLRCNQSVHLVHKEGLPYPYELYSGHYAHVPY